LAGQSVPVVLKALVDGRAFRTMMGSGVVFTTSRFSAQPVAFKLNGKTIRPLGRESDKALGIVRVPERPIEVLIAASILVSAVHAFRPIFPGREAWIAAFFGLIHGLAFAATLDRLGLGRWEHLAFNLGIERCRCS
jgi:hypothetical protein